MDSPKLNTKKSEAVVKKVTVYKGVVTTPFKVKDKHYVLGDKYSTKDKGSFNALIEKRRIKKAEKQ